MAPLTTQLALGLVEAPMLTSAIDESGDHGEVFTRRWVVDLILDLVGYTPDRDLGGLVAVEPSCGAGAFLGPMVERLVDSCDRHSRPLSDSVGAIRAFDILHGNAELGRKMAAATLEAHGLDSDEARELAAQWVRHGDFLLTDHEPAGADFVVGNPPYVRLENVAADRSAAYRRACPTMRGRSDIFVGFIETGLRLLGDDGVLGFIVADRWMRNQYGAELRELVAEAFAVENVLVMHDVDAFEERVSAYPAVTVIRRAQQRVAIVGEATAEFGPSDAERYVSWSRSRRREMKCNAVDAAKLPGWFDGRLSWPTGSPSRLALVADLEKRFAPLEDPRTGTRVGIGVATGADDVYLTTDPELVEADRLLPLLMTRDIVDGAARWSGTLMVNPWHDGKLVDLASFPRFAEYLRAHAGIIKARHVARTRPECWYRTIDRVEPKLLERPKLLFPELKAFIHPVLDEGVTYPHHGLYHVTSDAWDLEVLGGLLLSSLAELFVSTYCVKMRGGCYRFQAQYLRRIRVPEFSSIKKRERRSLARAFAARDVEAATATASLLYGVDRAVTGSLRMKNGLV